MTPLPTVQSQSPVNKGGTANVMLILRQIPSFKETFDNQVIHFLKWNGFKSPTIHDFEDTSAQLSLCIFTYRITLGDKRRLLLSFSICFPTISLGAFTFYNTRISFVYEGQSYLILVQFLLQNCISKFSKKNKPINKAYLNKY